MLCSQVAFVAGNIARGTGSGTIVRLLATVSFVGVGRACSATSPWPAPRCLSLRLGLAQRVPVDQHSEPRGLFLWSPVYLGGRGVVNELLDVSVRGVHAGTCGYRGYKLTQYTRGWSTNCVFTYRGYKLTTEHEYSEYNECRDIMLTSVYARMEHELRERPCKVPSI
jgi:hypothetical protein